MAKLFSIRGGSTESDVFSEPEHDWLNHSPLFVCLKSSDLHRVMCSFYLLFRSVTVCFLRRLKKSKPFIPKIEI